ncbi:hypothetical protein ACFQJ7_17410 [Halovenus rubra]|uniref:Uncharacterized protein n=2 Tax=Halovenus rubra TaxID=869890 RepID=A0ACC7E237_9EURY|nr:hypothetical protein [Halovenus rubra]
MVSKDEFLAYIPHYVAMVAIALLVMTALREVIGEQHVLVEFVLILVLIFGYRPVVTRLDFVPTPKLWDELE